MVTILAPKSLSVPNLPAGPVPRVPLRLVPTPPPEVPTPRFGGAFGGVAFTINMLWTGKAAYDAVKAVPSQLPWMPGPNVDPEIWTDPKRVIEEAHARFGKIDTPDLNRLRFIREKQAVPVWRDIIHDPSNRNLMVSDDDGNWVQVPLDGQISGALVIGDIWKNEFSRKPLYERANDEEKLIEIELGQRNPQLKEPKKDTDKTRVEQYIEYVQKFLEALRQRENGENVPLPTLVINVPEETKMEPQSKPLIMCSANTTNTNSTQPADNTLGTAVNENNEAANPDVNPAIAPMEKEKIFSKGGYYTFIVENDILGHQEATAIVTQLIARNFANHKTPIRVLDLACGGDPIVISEAMKRNGNLKFIYTGIDINADQVEKAAHWPHYPENVIQASIIQGNAWNPAPLQLDGKFDVIFSGLNFHHATPEELYFLANELGHLLSSEGIVVSHDIYRPDNEPYLRRPDVNPTNPGETYRLVDTRDLARVNIPQLHMTGTLYGAHQYDWRDSYLEKYRLLLEANGADTAGATDVLAHNYERDFPVSTDEIASILSQAGYQSTTYGFDTTPHPLGRYLAIVVATRR